MAQLSGSALRHSSENLTESAPSNSYLLGSHGDIPELPLPKLACCCGQSCPFSKHCNASLNEMQNDLLTAARAGQALLVRHEAYIVDSERERRRLTGIMEQSQMEKHMAEAVNANLLQENKLLQSQLEELNQSVADSDAHIKSLDAMLRSTRQELHRLSGLASRTLQLEAELNAMECEIAQLQQVARGAQEQEKATIQRCKDAERNLQALQDEVERIEKRTKEERDLHSEVVASLRRKQLVDAELKYAVGELSTSDSQRGHSSSAPNSNVISHFVKDILQDNTNLQASMVELRDMLLASHEENERLKEELMLHKPAVAENKRNILTASLAEDLCLDSSRPNERETHTHHRPYYETPNIARKSCRPSGESSVDGTMGLSSAALPAPYPIWTTTPHSRRHLTSSAATVVSQTSITIISEANARSSVFSKPHLSQRGSIPHDQTVNDSAIGFLPPTSPGSNGLTTLTSALSRRGGVSELLSPVSRKAPSSPLKPSAKCELDAQCATALGVDGSDIVASLDLSAAQAISRSQTAAGQRPGVRGIAKNMTIGRGFPLGRSSSHESLFSISGMDIHTLRDRPSRPIVTGSGLLPRTTTQTFSVSAAPISDMPVMGAMATSVRPSVVRHHYDSSTYNRSLLQGSNRSRAAERSVAVPLGQSRDTLRRKLGDWMWGKWASGSTSSTESLQAKAAQPEKPKDHPGKGHGGPKVETNSSSQESVKSTATDSNETLLRESLLE